MRGLKTLLFTSMLLAPLALLPLANAEISVNIGAPPVCSYGYYDYSPYACSLLVTMDRAISTTASSWAWAPGLAGAITTVGAVIASAIAVGEDILVGFTALRSIVGVQTAHR
jgi:hypothetical protein